MFSVNSNLFINTVSLKDHAEVSDELYPFNLPIVQILRSKLQFTSNITFFVGENGSGKSTLLEALAISVGLNPEGGTANFNFNTRHSHSPLCDHLRVGKNKKRPKNSYFLRAESFFNVATEIEHLDKEPAGPKIIDSYGGTSLHEQSHGESFMALIQNRFGSNGLYILDEPEAALSPKKQMTLLCTLNDLIKRNCQFIIATHSPILLSFPNSEIYEISKECVKKTPYEETDTYKTTKDFLNHHQKYLHYLLNDDT